MARSRSLPFYRQSKRRRARPEADLQAAVMQHMRLLAADGAVALSIPNERRCSEATGALLNRMGRMAGAADLLILRRGHVPAFLELKAKGETQSFEQAEFEMLCHDMGFPYAVADNIDAAVATLRSWGAIKPDAARRAA